MDRLTCGLYLFYLFILCLKVGYNKKINNNNNNTQVIKTIY